MLPWQRPAPAQGLTQWSRNSRVKLCWLSRDGREEIYCVAGSASSQETKTVIQTILFKTCQRCDTYCKPLHIAKQNCSGTNSAMTNSFVFPLHTEFSPDEIKVVFLFIYNQNTQITYSAPGPRPCWNTPRWILDCFAQLKSSCCTRVFFLIRGTQRHKTSGINMDNLVDFCTWRKGSVVYMISTPDRLSS